MSLLPYLTTPASCTLILFGCICNSSFLPINKPEITSPSVHHKVYFTLPQAATDPAHETFPSSVFIQNQIHKLRMNKYMWYCLLVCLFICFHSCYWLCTTTIQNQTGTMNLLVLRESSHRPDCTQWWWDVSASVSSLFSFSFQAQGCMALAV